MKPASPFTLCLILFVVFFDWMGISLVYPMFSSMLFCSDCPLVHIGTSEALRGWYLGLLLAAMSIAQFFSGPILGALSDQKGRKPLFLFSLALGILGYSFCAIAVWINSLAFLIAARVIVGIAAGNAAVVSATIADFSNAGSKAKYFGLYSMASGIGFTTGSFLGGELSKISFSFPFIFSGFLLLVNLFLIFLFFKETYAPNKPSSSLRWDTGFRNLRKAFAIQKLRVLFLVILCFCFGWSFFYEFIPVTWISDYKFTTAQIGFFYAYGAGVYALSSGLLIRPIVTRFKNSSILLYALALLACLLLVLLMSHPTEFWIWIYLPLVNFLMALLYPTSTAMISDWANKDSQGEILGILQSVQATAFAISPLAAGTLLGAHPHMPMLIGSLAMLIALLLLALSLFRTSHALH